MPRGLIPWVIAAAAVAALALGAFVANARIADLNGALNVARSVDQSARMAAAGAVVVTDTPRPPSVPSQLQDQVEAVQRAAPEARVERTADVQTVWIEAQGPVLPCEQVTPQPGAPGTPEPAAGALLRRGDRFRIRLISVDLSTPQGAAGVVGEGELIRFDGASLGRGPLDQDASTVTRRQRPQDAPRWWAVPSLGVTSRARAWAGVAIGRGRWGGVLAGAWKPGDAEVFVGGSARF